MLDHPEIISYFRAINAARIERYEQEAAEARAAIRRKAHRKLRVECVIVAALLGVLALMAASCSSTPTVYNLEAGDGCGYVWLCPTNEQEV